MSLATKASLWRETLPALKQVIAARWPWLLAFILISGAAQYFIFSQAPTPAIMAQLKANPLLFKQHPELEPHTGVLSFLIAIGQLMLTIFACYISPLFYLQLAAKNAPPQPTVGGFFYWFGKSIQKYLIWIGVLLVTGLALGILFALLAVIKPPGIIKIPLTLVSVIGVFVLSYYVYFRLYLVTPLAILGKSPVIKTSRELTKGKCWRIFWNAFALFVITGVVFIIPLLGLMYVKFHGMFSGQPANPVIDIVLPLIQSSLSGVFIMTAAVYQCTIYRIILREQRPN